MRSNPRGRWFLIVPVLLLILTAPAAAKPQNLVKFFFLNSGVQTGAEAKILFMTNPAQTFFTIQVSNMTPGTYDVVLNAAIVDTITVNADGTGSVTHRSKLNGKHAGAPLPYNPLGGAVSIQSAGVDLLTANVPATAAEAQQKIRIVSTLTNMGTGTGEAEAVFRSRFGRMQFDVTVHDAAPGTFDVVVGGVTVGQVTIDATGRGEIEFDSVPGDDGLAQLLTFDPRGQMVQLMQTTTVMFQATFPLS